LYTAFALELADNSRTAKVLEREPRYPGGETTGWNLATRIAFRFTCCYLVLYNLPFPLGRIPGTGLVVVFYFRLWTAISAWVGARLFHLSGPVLTLRPTGSGDTTLSYLQNFCYLALALIGGTVWQLLDAGGARLKPRTARRAAYPTLHSWLRLMVRYSLSFTLFSYGLIKLFPNQMPAPNLMRLTEPYGQFSPMGVLWSFIGSSAPYERFSGAAEIAGAVLLLFRRTTTLGALISAGVLLNVVMLNFTYDVPVKLFSLNLLLMAVFLAAPDLGRLVRFFILNRSVSLNAQPRPTFKPRWARIGAIAFQIFFVGFFLVQTTVRSYTQYRSQTAAVTRPALYGLYEVDGFERNGEEVSPLAADSTRWRKVAIEFPTFMQVRMMDDSLRGFAAQYDPAGASITLVLPGGSKFKLACSRIDADHLVMQGTLGRDALVVRMRKIDTSRFPLLSRGFHWITEFPFNR
jgi:hypothetical protein